MPVHSLDEPCERRAEETGAVVVDDERNLQRFGGEGGLKDLSGFATFFDGKVGSREIADGTPFLSVTVTYTVRGTWVA